MPERTYTSAQVRVTATERTEPVERRCYWLDSGVRCRKPARFVFDGHGYCDWHYGPANRSLGINRPDEVLPK